MRVAPAPQDNADYCTGSKLGLIEFRDLATVLASLGKEPSPHRMPLHFGKIGAAIALLTVAAFVLWLIFTTLFATEQAEQRIDQTGAAAILGGNLS